MSDATEPMTQGNLGESVRGQWDRLVDRLRALVGLAPRGPRKPTYLFYRHTIPVDAPAITAPAPEIHDSAVAACCVSVWMSRMHR